MIRTRVAAQSTQSTSESDARSSRLDARADDSLLARFRRADSDAARNQVRNQLIERYRGLVEGIARALCLRLPRSVDVHDLVHAGIWGLIQAIDAFEPERGTGFVPFMRLRVRGAMVDELRQLDFLPRLLRLRLRARDHAVARLRSELQREPNDQELALELGVTETQLRRRFSAALPLRQSVHRDPMRDDEGRDLDLLDALVDDALEAPIEAVHRRELLDLIAQSLEPVEWAVLKLHYLDGMSGKDVAKRLRLSASRICQIHGRVLTRLKARLAARA